MKSKNTWPIIIRTFLPIPKNLWCIFGISTRVFVATPSSLFNLCVTLSACWGTWKEYDCTKVVYYVHLLCWVLVYMTLLSKWTRAKPHTSKNGVKGRPPNHTLTQKVTWWTLVWLTVKNTLSDSMLAFQLWGLIACTSEEMVGIHGRPQKTVQNVMGTKTTHFPCASPKAPDCCIVTMNRSSLKIQPWTLTTIVWSRLHVQLSMLHFS